MRPPLLPARDVLGVVNAGVTCADAGPADRLRATRRVRWRPRATRSNAEAGSTRSESSPSSRPRCSRHRRRRVSRGRTRAPSPRPAGSSGSRSSCVGVEHGTRQLGVVRPRTPVQVVGADFEPHVVDHANLGVHVDRRAVHVLEVVDRDASHRPPRGASRSRAGGRCSRRSPKPARPARRSAAPPRSRAARAGGAGRRRSRRPTRLTTGTDPRRR